MTKRAHYHLAFLNGCCYTSVKEKSNVSHSIIKQQKQEKSQRMP